jgi:hypothetical protein
VTLLSACAAGGGGETVREVTFTSFDAVQPNDTVVMTGTAQTASGTMTGSTINTVTLGPAAEDGTLRLTYDGSAKLSGINFSTPSASASFNDVTCEAGVCAADTATSTVVGIDAKTVGWNYQTFGVWLQQPSATTFQAGAMSAGAVTPASAVPTTGTANFSGAAGGFFVNPAGAAFVTTAEMNAAVNFSMRSIVFGTDNTRITNLDGSGLPSSAANLNLSGNLGYGLGTNQFTGTINTQDISMSGSATGRFYGPAAQEMGGTYQLSGAGPSRMIGAFGGKQQ